MKYLWTTIYVKDLDESITFYSNMLGLKMLKRFPAGPGIEIAFMGNGSNNETLVELLVDINNKTVSHGESIALGFAVDSVDAMLDTIKSKNISVHNGPVETPSSKFFTIKDPNDLNVQFFQQK
jgi:lactoylglutathione lyase